MSVEGIVQLTALVLVLAVGWLLTHQRTRSLRLEFIAPTWRRLASTASSRSSPCSARTSLRRPTPRPASCALPSAVD